MSPDVEGGPGSWDPEIVSDFKTFCTKPELFGWGKYKYWPNGHSLKHAKLGQHLEIG